MRTKTGVLFAVALTLYCAWSYFHAPGGRAALDWLALALLLPSFAAAGYAVGWLSGLMVERIVRRGN